MNRYSLFVIVVLAITTPTVALAQSTTQEWTFKTAPGDPNNIPPDSASNPFQPPPSGTALNSGWVPNDNGHTGVLQLVAGNQAVFSAPNANNFGKRKTGTFTVVYRLSDGSQLAAGDVPRVYDNQGSPMEGGHGNDAAADNGWRIYTTGFNVAYCPPSERGFVFAPAGLDISIDTVQLATECNPSKGVPTLSEVGMLALVLLMLTAGSVVLSKRMRISETN